MAVLAAAYDSRFAELRTGVQPTTYEAYEQLMQAGEFFVNGEFEKALASNARAAQADSTSMRPWIDASWIYINLDRLSDVDSILRHIEPRRATLNDADRAIIDLQRAIIDGDRMAQLQSARRLAKAAPGAPWSTYQQALYALAAGYPREALAAASRVESTYGLTGTSWMTGGLFRVVTRAHHMLGEHKAELEAARRARRAHPDSRTLLGHELRALVALAASGAPGSIDALRDGLAELARMPATSGGGVSAPLLLLQTAEELEVHGLAALAREAARYALAADSARSPAERERLAFERARAYYLLGEYSEAKRIIERLAQQSRNNPHQRDFTGMLGLIAAHDGRRAEAAAVDARLQDMDVPYDQGRTTYARARVAAALGDAPQALGLLQQSMREGVAWYTPHSDPELRPLRDDPRFVQLMRPRE
jgi:tetratricopeptide (TPR) repeat protein